MLPKFEIAERHSVIEKAKLKSVLLFNNDMSINLIMNRINDFSYKTEINDNVFNVNLIQLLVKSPLKSPFHKNAYSANNYHKKTHCNLNYHNPFLFNVLVMPIYLTCILN